MRQLLHQQIEPRLLVQRGIIGRDAGLRQQFANHSLVHAAVLSHVQRGKVKAECFHRADEPA